LQVNSLIVIASMWSGDETTGVKIDSFMEIITPLPQDTYHRVRLM